MTLVIDGSQGEGGGQILRTSLALSVLTKTPVELVKIRAGRVKPGLLRQHLTAVRAAEHISGAEVPPTHGWPRVSRSRDASTWTPRGPAVRACCC
jgi:RNA 3'-terminal phosphate cyclase